MDEAERGGHDRCAALLRPSNKITTTVTPTKTTKLDSKTEEEDDDIFKTLSWTCKKVDVPAGDVFELPVSVVVPSKNLVLTWNFTSYGGDVGFGVVNQDDDTDIVLLRRTDVPSGVAISGSVDIPARCNTLLILFDNTYSWWNDKQVSYKFELRNSIMSSSSSKNRMSKKKQTSSDRIKACREVMRLTRGAIENASEAAKSLRLNREEAERHLRMLEEKVKHARRNLFRCVAAVNAAEDTVENLNSRMRSLVLKHVMSYDSIRSCDLVRRYLEKEDIASFRCTSLCDGIVFFRRHHACNHPCIHFSQITGRCCIYMFTSMIITIYIPSFINNKQRQTTAGRWNRFKKKQLTNEKSEIGFN